MLEPRENRILEGNILFLEDTHEPGRKIDEALAQLQEDALLDEVMAVIWGQFSGDQRDINNAKRLFKEEMTRIGKPFFSADYFGHSPHNYPLPFCTPARIEAGGRLTVKTNNA